jgi:hypothetical protein
VSEQEALRIAAEALAKAMNKIQDKNGPEYTSLAQAYAKLEEMRYKMATQRRLW